MMMFILFLTIVLSVWTGMHLLIYFRLTHLIPVSARTRLIFKIGLILLSSTIVIGRFLSAWLHTHLLQDISYIWLGVMATLFFLLCLAWPLNALKPQWNGPAAGVVIILTVLISLLGLINHARGHVVNRIQLTTPEQGGSNKDLKIVQLSDLHLERNTSPGWVRRLVDDTLAEKPDLIVITGDILEESLLEGSSAIREFSRLRAPLGVYAVSGNHEVYTGIHHVEAFLKTCGIEFLRNEQRNIDAGVTIIGFDDDELGRGDVNFQSRQLALLGNLDPKRYNVLLYHRPTGFEKHVGMGVDLQLSGHTHAGQTVPMNLIVQLYYRYPQGLYFFKSGAIYVSRGTGIWGPPMRFPGRSELSVISIARSRTLAAQ